MNAADLNTDPDDLRAAMRDVMTELEDTLEGMRNGTDHSEDLVTAAWRAVDTLREALGGEPGWASLLF